MIIILRAKESNISFALYTLANCSCMKRKSPIDFVSVVDLLILDALSANRKSNNKVGGYSMPIELLVPIGIFVLGIVVSVTLSGLGIERIIEGEKKK